MYVNPRDRKSASLNVTITVMADMSLSRAAIRAALLVLSLALAGCATRGPQAQPAAANSVTDDVAVRPIDPGNVRLPSASESASDRKFSFIAYGDTRGRADGVRIQSEHRDVVDAMLRTIQTQRDAGIPVRFIVQSGDAVANGRFGRQWNVSFTPLIERLIQQGGAPYFFAVGNHDVGTSTNLDDERRKIGLRNTSAAMSRLWPAEDSAERLTGYATYTFAYGQLFFIVLDSNLAGDARQLAWVSAQLSKLDRQRYPHVIAVFHHPPLTSGQHGGATIEPQTAAVRRLYMPLFRQHHVRLVITGHDHLYDHFVEHYEDAGGTYRMDLVVTGGGGAPIYTYSSEPDLAAYARTASPTKVSVDHLVRPGSTDADNPHHFVVVTVDGDRLSLRVVAAPAAPFRPFGTETLNLALESHEAR
ncbi:MAG: metallophosphoesterase, partial [Vicinamibacterales bacterium]